MNLKRIYCHDVIEGGNRHEEIIPQTELLKAIKCSFYHNHSDDDDNEDDENDDAAGDGAVRTCKKYTYSSHVSDNPF